VQSFANLFPGFVQILVQLPVGLFRIGLNGFKRLTRLRFSFLVFRPRAGPQRKCNNENSGESHARPRCTLTANQVIESGPSDRESSVSIASRRSNAVLTAESRPTQ